MYVAIHIHYLPCGVVRLDLKSFWVKRRYPPLNPTPPALATSQSGSSFKNCMLYYFLQSTSSPHGKNNNSFSRNPHRINFTNPFLDQPNQPQK